MARDFPRRGFVGDQTLAQKRNVLMVPRVAIGDADALGYAVQLVTVVPPRPDRNVSLHEKKAKIGQRT